jgi:hypothetical protein
MGMAVMRAVAIPKPIVIGIAGMAVMHGMPMFAAIGGVMALTLQGRVTLRA